MACPPAFRYMYHSRFLCFNLATVPLARRQSLTEATDYKTDWTYEEAEALQKAAEEAYLKQFNTETEVPTGAFHRRFKMSATSTTTAVSRDPAAVEACNFNRHIAGSIIATRDDWGGDC